MLNISNMNAVHYSVTYISFTLTYSDNLKVYSQSMPKVHSTCNKHLTNI